MRARATRFVKLWIDLFDKHELLDRASAISFAVLKALVPLTLLGLAMLGEVGQRHAWKGRYPLSLGLAAAIAICVIGATLAVFAASALASHGALEVVVALGRWLVAIVLLGLAVALLVRYAPVEPRSTSWITGGSVLV